MLALACCSCAGRPLQGVLIPAAESAEGASRVPILIATTRQRSDSDPGEMFNTDRAQAMSYARIAVSIPPDDSRKIGDIQWPASPPGDPHRDFVTVSAEYLDNGLQHSSRNRFQNDAPKQGDGLRSWIQQPL